MRPNLSPDDCGVRPRAAPLACCSRESAWNEKHPDGRLELSETELVKDGSALPLDTRLCDALCGQQSLRLTVRRAAKATADGEDSASSTSEAEPVEGTAESSIASALSSVEKLVADVVGTGVSINPRMVQNHHLAPTNSSRARASLGIHLSPGAGVRRARASALLEGARERQRAERSVSARYLRFDHERAQARAVRGTAPLHRAQLLEERPCEDQANHVSAVPGQRAGAP